MQPNNSATIVWILYWLALCGGLLYTDAIPQKVALVTFTVAVIVTLVVHQGIHAIAG